MPLSQKTRMLPGGDLTVTQDVGKSDKRWHPIGCGGQFIDDRAIRGEELLRIAQPDIIERWCVTRQGIVGCRIMVFHRVMHSPDQ